MVASSGSGSTSLNTLSRSTWRWRLNSSTTPRCSLSTSVITTTLVQGTSRRFSNAPALKNVLAGTRNHWGGVRRWDTVLMLRSCM